MTPEQWWGAALFMLVSSITPGPNNTMLMASGVHFGYRRTLPHLMGVQLGFGFMLIAVGLGLHAVLAQFPAFYDAVRYAGAAYMVWMAWSLASARPRVEAHTAQGASGYGETQAFEDDVYQPQAIIASAAKQSKNYGESNTHGSLPSTVPGEAVPTQPTSVPNEPSPFRLLGRCVVSMGQPESLGDGGHRHERLRAARCRFAAHRVAGTDVYGAGFAVFLPVGRIWQRAAQLFAKPVSYAGV